MFRIAAELGQDIGAVEAVVNPTPVTYAAGRRDVFWLVDLAGLEIYQSEFELRLVTDHAYWYFEDGQNVRQQDLERAAAEFETKIYPGVTAVFGREPDPGIDNDPHLNIINARLSGVGGYFSSSDEYPAAIKPFSNEREIIYINTGSIPVSSKVYTEVLAHELQHAVHWNADPSEDTWVNEGLAELAATIIGHSTPSIPSFLHSRPTSLVNWSLGPTAGQANYGSASLFMHYLTEHYGDRADLTPLLNEPTNGVPGVEAFLAAGGHTLGFNGVFRDWAVANLVDQPDGPYSYAGLEVRAAVHQRLKGPAVFESQIPQYAIEYVELESLKGPVRLTFTAPISTDLIPTEVGPRGCWWSNVGDSIDSTLTHQVDLTSVREATIAYEVWHGLEESWDYAYLEISLDGGKTWQVQETPNTSPENPIGNSLGPGYTGDSGGWLAESVALGSFAGQEIMVRFQYITDDAVNGPGLCLRGLSIPEAGIGPDSPGWESAGFVFTDNRVKQDFIVQVVLGEEIPQVVQISLDGNNAGSLDIDHAGELDRVVVVVAALAPATREMASYSLNVVALQ